MARNHSATKLVFKWMVTTVHSTQAVKDAALAAQELAAAEEESKTTAMMFALLQEQHKAQLKAMAASNKQSMNAMLKCMYALIVGQGKAADCQDTQQQHRPSNQNRDPLEESMPELQKACLPQTANLLRAQGQCKQHYPGWKLSKVASAPV